MKIKIFLLSWLFFFCLSPQIAWGKNVVYILPHADDEMVLAGSLKRSLDDKDEVYAVLAVNGENTAAVYKINGQAPSGKRVYCPLHHKFHNPILSCYPFLAEKGEVAEAREREFLRSMDRLGLKKQNIFLAEKDWGIKVIDGKMTAEEGDKVVAKAWEIVGEGEYITLHADLKHNDHQMLYNALLKNEQIKAKAFFAEDTIRGKLVILSKKEFLAKRYALASYFAWNPWRGDYAVGAHSVYEMIQKWSDSHFEYILQ